MRPGPRIGRVLNRLTPCRYQKTDREVGIATRGVNTMAMTASVKDELSRVDVSKPCCRRSEMAALLRFAGGLHIVSGRVVVEAELDTGATARRLRREVAEVYGYPSGV